jgi:hypothetical protein
MGRSLLLLASTLLAMPTSTAGAVLGEPFELKVDERVEVETTELTLTFLRVDSDSRCPTDVVCVWAGEAKLVLGARVEDGDEAELVLVTPGDGATATFLRYKVEVVALAPEPDSRRKIAPEDYVATLRVTREDAEDGV